MTEILASATHRLRRTRAEEAPLVHDAEGHPDNAPYVGRWPVERHTAALDDPDVLHMIVEERLPSGSWSAPLGFVILQGLTNEYRTIELKRLAVFEKDRGVGRAVLQLVKRIAFDERNAHRLWFDVVATNARARHVYRTEGFVEEGMLRECSEWEGKRESLVLMAMLEPEYRSWVRNG